MRWRGSMPRPFPGDAPSTGSSPPRSFGRNSYPNLSVLWAEGSRADICHPALMSGGIMGAGNAYVGRNENRLERSQGPKEPAQGRGRGTCLGPRGTGHEPQTVRESRAFLAALQSPRGGGSRQPQASAARTAPLSVDLGRQPRRILHGSRRRLEEPGAGGVIDAEPRWTIS